MIRRNQLIRLFVGFTYSCMVLLAAGCHDSDPATKQSGKTYEGPPKLVVGAHFLDAGVLAPQSSTEKTVLIRNEGGQELKIERIQVACKCFEVSVADKVLKSGQESLLRVKFLTKTEKGEKRESVGIVSNDPERVHAVTLRFEVPREAHLTPGRADFGWVRPGQTVTMPILVEGREGVSGRVVYASSSTAMVLAKVVAPEFAPGKPAKLDVGVKIPSDAPTGSSRCDANVATSLKELSSLVVPITVCVSKTASVAPHLVDLGKCRRGQPASREAQITSESGTVVKGAKAVPPVLDIKTEAAGTGQYKLTAALSPKAGYGAFAGEIQVEIDGPEKGTLTIPFCGYVTDEAETAGR